MKSVVCVIVWDNYSILWINYPEIPTNGSEAHSQLYNNKIWVGLSQLTKNS